MMAKEGQYDWTVSTADVDRVCMATTTRDRSYCGRRGRLLVNVWRRVVCADCRAAARADGAL